MNAPVTSTWMAGVVYAPARSVPYRYVGTEGAKSDRYAPRLTVDFTRSARMRPSASSAISASVW